MITVLQVITLLQGVFLLGVLIYSRNAYRKPALWLLVGAIVSILFFVLGDDDNNLLSKNVDWFFFDTSLFITFLFLFVKYYVSERKVFLKRDILYFIPNILYFFNEISEVLNTALEDLFLIDVFELAIELTFLAYLFLTIRTLFTSKKQRWMLFAMIPLAIMISTSICNEVLFWFDFPEIEIFSDAAFTTYSLIIVASLFYFISIKLIVSPKQVLLSSENGKYKSSGLNQNHVEEYKNRIVAFMEVEKGYSDTKLTLSVLSEKVQIPKQYISEILNLHLHTNFQDFVNGYRVEAFVNCLQNDQYDHLTLMGIANEVGFNSKSSFYTTFRKHKGVTPSEFKKAVAMS